MSIHSLQLKRPFMGESLMLGMLEGPKDLRQERKGGKKRKNSPFIAGGLVGEIYFDVPGTAKSPEARQVIA